LDTPPLLLINLFTDLRPTIKDRHVPL
jgi:hypothetical protein